MNIDVSITKYMKSEAGRVVAIEYSAALTHADYAGVSSHTAGVVVSNLDQNATVEDMKGFISSLITGDANLVSVHLSDLNFKYTLASAVLYSTAPELTSEELRAQMPVLSRRQFWLGADSLGLSKADVLAATDDPQIRIEIEETTEFQRTYESVVLLSGLFGITPAQLDDVWLWWASA